MVNVSTVLLAARRQGAGLGHQTWIESLRVYCKAGRGGNGQPTVGGVGGRGGDVIIECVDKKSKHHNDSFKSLHEVFKKDFKGDPSKQKLVAGAGSNARIQRVIGEMGAPVVLQVLANYVQSNLVVTITVITKEI